MKILFGIEYGRGCTANVINDGPALGPAAVREMFPDANWIMIQPDDIPLDAVRADRFGENALIQKKIYDATPSVPHVLIGGDHSVNFGHFAALADRAGDADVCLIYIDAHLDIHTPESSKTQASGAPHGTNVRALLGDGDARWLALQKRVPAVKAENVFYIATRSYEDAEIECVRAKNISVYTPERLKTLADVNNVIAEIRTRIGAKKYVVSFDFDAIDPKYFNDVLVPEPNGISADAAIAITHAFAPDAYGFEFVEYAPTSDTVTRELARELISIALRE